MRVLTIVGPTHYRTDGGLYCDKPIPSIADQINIELDALEALGASNITVDIKPIDREWHLGTITYNGTLAHAKAETFTIQQVADRLNVSRSTIQERIRRHQIKVIPMGRRRVIPATEYHRLISSAN